MGLSLQGIANVHCKYVEGEHVIALSIQHHKQPANFLFTRLRAQKSVETVEVHLFPDLHIPKNRR